MRAVQTAPATYDVINEDDTTNTVKVKVIDGKAKCLTDNKTTCEHAKAVQKLIDG